MDCTTITKSHHCTLKFVLFNPSSTIHFNYIHYQFFCSLPSIFIRRRRSKWIHEISAVKIISFSRLFSGHA